MTYDFQFKVIRRFWHAFNFIKKYNISYDQQQCNQLDWTKNEKLCTWFDKLKLCFLFLSFKKNYPFLLALPCLPVCKPMAVGPGVAIRAKVKKKVRIIFLYWEKGGKCVNKSPISHMKPELTSRIP